MDWFFAVIHWMVVNEKLAGWAQAGGALLAIAIAIWVPARQSSNQRRADRRRYAEALRAVGAIVRRGSDLVSEHVDTVFRADPDGFTRVEVDNSRFTIVEEALRAIPLHGLPGDDIVDAVTMATVDVRRASILLGHVENQLNRFATPEKEVATELRKIQTRLRGAVTVLFDAAKLVEKGDR